MVEILVVWMLAKTNSANAEHKGRNGTAYRWLTVLMWFGAEFAAGFVAYVAANHRFTYTVYLYSFVASIVGGVMSYVLVKVLPPIYTSPPVPWQAAGLVGQARLQAPVDGQGPTFEAAPRYEPAAGPVQVQTYTPYVPAPAAGPWLNKNAQAAQDTSGVASPPVQNREVPWPES